MAEGSLVLREMESITRTQRQIEAHKRELARLEGVQQTPLLLQALPPGELSAAAVVHDRRAKLYAFTSFLHIGCLYKTSSLNCPVGLSRHVECCFGRWDATCSVLVAVVHVHLSNRCKAYAANVTNPTRHYVTIQKVMHKWTPLWCVM